MFFWGVGFKKNVEKKGGVSFGGDKERREKEDVIYDV